MKPIAEINEATALEYFSRLDALVTVENLANLERDVLMWRMAK